MSQFKRACMHARARSHLRRTPRKRVQHLPPSSPRCCVAAGCRPCSAAPWCTLACTLAMTGLLAQPRGDVHASTNPSHPSDWDCSFPTRSAPARPLHARARQRRRAPPRGVAPRTRPPRPPAHTRSRPARALGSRGARPGRGRGGGGEGRERAGASARTGTLSRAASRRVASQSPRCVRGPFARSLVARAKGHAPADKPGLTPCRPGVMPGSRK